MDKLSVVISTYNSENKIEECLKSVTFADEIVVVNNSSTDKTEEISKKYTSKVFRRPNNPMLNVNKNYGFTKASGDWILCLDDDERVTPELKKEIETTLNNKALDADGYYIPRKNIVFGKWIQHTGWYPDPQLRLFKKEKGKFEERHVHEMIKVSGKVEYLKEHLLHENYQSINQFLHKTTNIYTPNEAEVLIADGYRATFSDAIKFPLKEFLTRFFAQEGYKDGFHGLMLSVLMAFYHFCIFAYVWETQGFEDLAKKNVLGETTGELKNAGREINYWLRTEKIKNTKSPVKKILYKTLMRK